MTDQDLTGDGDTVLTLQQLIRARMDERGWSYGELERRADHRLTRGRWQQLGSGIRMTQFPEPDTIELLSTVLEVDIVTVLLAAGATLRPEWRITRGPNLAHLLPAGTDRLSERMRDAILAIIRAAVAETLTREYDPENAADDAELTLEWPRSDVGRNAPRRVGDRET